MKWDYAIGNPAYQDHTLGDNKGFAPPIYDKFLDAAFEIADKVEMIHPARFLFNAGSTPKAWNEKMLNDPHFKVLEYKEDATDVFSNTDIKGGVAITYRDTLQRFGAIGVFTKYANLNSVLRKVSGFLNTECFSNIVVSRTAYRLTQDLHKDHPEAITQLSSGHAYDMSTNIFDRLPQVFFDSCPNDNAEYIRIFGRFNNERVLKYVKRNYVNSVANLDKYKILIPKANGVGSFGEVLSMPVIFGPGIGSTETFVGIGCFNTKEEADSCFQYLKTKFFRSMLGILKTTQDITPEKFKYIPLQDFTSDSDIDWSTSIANIDKQLYKKYGFSQEEIDFIETHVKEME